MLGVILVVVIIIIVAASQSRKSANGPDGSGQTAGQTTGATPNAAIAPDSKGLAPAPVTGATSSQAAAVLKDAVVVAPGANPITSDNKVVTPAGQQTDNASQPMSDTAPKQTGFLNKETLPATLINISIGKAFTPSKFTTKAGAPTSFALTGADSFSHVLAFDDPSLAAIAILVGPGQTKAITFNAPTKPGTYTFRDASPDQTGTGEMVVQ